MPTNSGRFLPRSGQLLCPLLDRQISYSVMQGTERKIEASSSVAVKFGTRRDENLSYLALCHRIGTRAARHGIKDHPKKKTELEPGTPRTNFRL